MAKLKKTLDNLSWRLVGLMILLCTFWLVYRVEHLALITMFGGGATTLIKQIKADSPEATVIVWAVAKMFLSQLPAVLGLYLAIAGGLFGGRLMLFAMPAGSTIEWGGKTIWRSKL